MRYFLDIISVILTSSVKTLTSARYSVSTLLAPCQRRRFGSLHLSSSTVSNVACHLSLAPTATATDPAPANSPLSPLSTVGWLRKPKKVEKTHKINKTEEEEKIVSLKPNIRATPFDQKS